MTLVISSELVLGQAQILQDAGIIAYQNIVSKNTISASSELALSPATNMANSATAFGWEATSNADQTITINSSGAVIDYIGIARHNLNQPGLILTLKFNGAVVATKTDISDNPAILFLVNPASPTTITLEISGANIAPKMSVLYAGKSLTLERNIYVGHTPITMGVQRTAFDGVSESGQFLGEVVRNRSLFTNVSLKNLTPQWYRANLDPCFKRVPRNPLFWAWRPTQYPAEVAFAKIEGNPIPVNQRNNGMMQVDFKLRGLA